MNPSELLGSTVAITVGACFAESILRRRHAEALRRLASEWRMNFSLTDRLNLTGKVARHFPIPGAANLRVTNVIYGTARDRYRYVFTAEYTTGVVRAKRRFMQAGSFSEPRGREEAPSVETVVLAISTQPLVEQYRELGARQGEIADDRQAQ
jgi:hypothetical protein